LTNDLFNGIHSHSSFLLLKKHIPNFEEIVKNYRGVEPAIFMVPVLLSTIGPQELDTIKGKKNIFFL